MSTENKLVTFDKNKLLLENANLYDHSYKDDLITFLYINYTYIPITTNLNKKETSFYSV